MGWSDSTATWSDTTDTWASPDAVSLTPTIEWSPTTSPGAVPDWEDITHLVRAGSISRGRQSEFDRTSAGTLRLTVDNRARDFDPQENSQARPNKRIRVTVGSGVDTVSLFDGWIDQMPQAYNPPNDATVALTATDGFKLLSRFSLDEIYAPLVVADDPTGWWRLADDLPLTSVAVDSSGNGHDATWRGNAQPTGSLVNDGPGGVSLDGEDDGAVYPVGLLSSTPLTIEAWVKTGKYGTNAGFIAGQTHEIGGANPQFIRDFVLFMDNNSGVAQFTARMVGESNLTVTGTTVLRDTGVHHLVGTIQSDRKLRLYVDGVLEGGPSAAATGTTVDNTGRFRIGRPPTNNETGAGDVYKCFKGDMAEVAVYGSALSAATVLEHYEAGAAPWADDTTGARVARILDLVGWPAGDRSIETGASTLGAVRDLTGDAALDHLLTVEDTEQGRFFISGAGVATFYDRNHETSTSAVAEFSDDEIADLTFDYNDSNITNDMTVSRAGGLPQRAEDQDSIDAYWRLSDSKSGMLYSTDNEALAMAQWRVQNYAQPTMRPTGLRFQPIRDPSAMFHRVLDRELGDRIEVTKVLGGADVTVDAAIEGITHEFRPGPLWETQWNLAPLVYGQFGPGGGGGFAFVKLNDLTLGQLDNDNRLGF